MKTIIAYTLALIALAALVYGKDDRRSIRSASITLQSEHEFESHVPYRRLSRTRRADRVCEPGSTKTIECDNHCFCIGDGSGWGCTEKGCDFRQLPSSDQANSSPKA